MINSHFFTVLAILLIVGAAGVYVGQKFTSPPPTAMMAAAAAPITTEDKIQNAMTAAPAAISDEATIMDWPSGTSSELLMLRQGINDWTCLPDDPNNPTNDPICVDKTALAWFGAYMAHEAPHITQNGYAYMLQGGSTADNDAPYASAPPEGKEWMHEPPHVMVFSPKAPDTKVYGTEMGHGPWVMWPGTPYAHLMVPVE